MNRFTTTTQCNTCGGGTGQSKACDCGAAFALRVADPPAEQVPNDLQLLIVSGDCTPEQIQCIANLRSQLATVMTHVRLVPVGQVSRLGRRQDGEPWHFGRFREDGSIDLRPGQMLYAEVK